jgi:phenylalanyl-tRNA synthetase beta chain
VDQNLLLQRAIPAFKSLSKFPQVRRDIAVIVAEQVDATRLATSIQGQYPALIRQVLIFDVYRGQGVESGKKSIALGLVLQDDAETLTDERVDAVIADVLALLSKEFDAKLRD